MSLACRSRFRQRYGCVWYDGVVVSVERDACELDGVAFDVVNIAFGTGEEERGVPAHNWRLRAQNLSVVDAPVQVDPVIQVNPPQVAV